MQSKIISADGEAPFFLFKLGGLLPLLDEDLVGCWLLKNPDGWR